MSAQQPVPAHPVEFTAKSDANFKVPTQLEAEIDERLSTIGDRILARASRDFADVHGDAARIIGERLRPIHELR